ncbi:hypothetical protein RUM44_003753 [Polyplax serrata]|uniref:Uncharacterized protein n=1 Tax=Polyplax serrata TaxID=468196 RepID=A0ABR1AHC1_POLSC
MVCGTMYYNPLRLTISVNDNDNDNDGRRSHNNDNLSPNGQYSKRITAILLEFLFDNKKATRRTMKKKKMRYALGCHITEANFIPLKPLNGGISWRRCSWLFLEGSSFPRFFALRVVSLKNLPDDEKQPTSFHQEPTKISSYGSGEIEKEKESRVEETGTLHAGAN